MSAWRRAEVAAALVASAGLLAAPCLAWPEVGASATISSCITRSASGRPWLEKTLWGLYDQEGGWTGAERRNSNGTVDLGPLQVNSLWVPVIAARLHREESAVQRWLRDDACFNIGVAAWIFLSGYDRERDYWHAVGLYHSSTRWRSQVYARTVADRLQRRFGSGIFHR